MKRLLVLLLIMYALGRENARFYRRGYKQGMWDQWFTTEVGNKMIWMGTGNPDGKRFPGLDEYMDLVRAKPDTEIDS